MSQAIYKSRVIYCLGHQLCNAAVSTVLHTHSPPHTRTDLQMEREREGAGELNSRGGFIWVKAILSGGFVLP